MLHLRAALLLAAAVPASGFTIKAAAAGRRAAPASRRTSEPEAKVPRTVNLSAGCSALPPHILEKCAAEFVNYIGRDGKERGLSIAEMGYRTNDFYELMDDAEDSFRKVMSVPDTHEVHFFNGGATLQFAAIPMNLLGKPGHYAVQAKSARSPASGGVYKIANYVRTGHWSEKARDEARMYCHVHEVNNCPDDLYFDVSDLSTWDIDERGTYIHYTAADTRQGLEIRDFPYQVVPEGMPLCVDASANLGSYPLDISKYGVVYAASHKNFATSGVCYTIIRKDLIDENVLPGTPTMCNWNRFQTAPGKVWTVPVVFSIWQGKMVCDWMLEMGGLPYFEELAIRRSNLLYDYIDESGGFYRCFVGRDEGPIGVRSRMQVVFTIKSGEGADAKLVEAFLDEAETKLGWLDIRAHPLGVDSPSIRVTMYNPMEVAIIEQVRDFMHEFKGRHS